VAIFDISFRTDFLKLSDSEEDECLANTSKRRHRSCASKRSHGRRSRDPDPTWSMSSPTHKKSGSRSFSTTPDRLLSPTTSRHQVSKVCLTGGGLHPLLKEPVGTPSSSKTLVSKRSTQKGPTHKKSGSRSFSTTPDRLLSPTTSRHQVSKVCLTGGGLHPLLKEPVGTPSSSKTLVSKRSTQKGFVPQDSSSGPLTTTASQRSLDKPRANTTVRQRLAKRLGL
ncbi:hypothetical protein AHF37_11667, partial [Paragonimus kellicotti]